MPHSSLWLCHHMMFFMCVSVPKFCLLKRTLVIVFESILIQYDLFNSITSEKTLFPNKAIFTGSGMAWVLGGKLFNPVHRTCLTTCFIPFLNFCFLICKMGWWYLPLQVVVKTQWKEMTYEKHQYGVLWIGVQPMSEFFLLFLSGQWPFYKILRISFFWIRVVWVIL